MQREFGHRVYLVNFGREGGEREATSSEEGEGQEEREHRLEVEEDLLASAEGGVGRACLLNRQGTHETGQTSRSNIPISFL